MTTKERLTLMEEIKRKNDTEWSRASRWLKYAKPSRPGWAWDASAQQTIHPFDSIGAKCILAVCIPVLLVLFVLMA